MPTADYFLQLLLFVLPAFVANAIPVLLGGGTPLDLGKNAWDGKRILGDGKTVRGFIAGIMGGLFIGVLLGLILPGTPYDFLHTTQLASQNGLVGLRYSPAPASLAYALLGFLLGLGTMLGDSLGSFTKRRLNFDRGAPTVLLDELFFLGIALLFAYPLAGKLYTLEGIAFLVIITYLLHKSTNWIAHKLGMKNVPW